jgi:hypothetical protein
VDSCPAEGFPNAPFCLQLRERQGRIRCSLLVQSVTVCGGWLAKIQRVSGNNQAQQEWSNLKVDSGWGIICIQYSFFSSQPHTSNHAFHRGTILGNDASHDFRLWRKENQNLDAGTHNGLKDRKPTVDELMLLVLRNLLIAAISTISPQRDPGPRRLWQGWS